MGIFQPSFKELSFRIVSSDKIDMSCSESFDCGKVPHYYKQTNISHIFKKGNRAEAGNYHTVALTLTLSRSMKEFSVFAWFD